MWACGRKAPAKEVNTLGQTATWLTRAAIGLIIALVVGGVIYAAANSKAANVGNQISGTTSCSASTCTN